MLEVGRGYPVLKVEILASRHSHGEKHFIPTVLGVAREDYYVLLIDDVLPEMKLL